MTQRNDTFREQWVLGKFAFAYNQLHEDQIIYAERNSESENPDFKAFRADKSYLFDIEITEALEEYRRRNEEYFEDKPYHEREINLVQFKKEHNNKYSLIQYDKCSLPGLTLPLLTDKFNKLIKISNLIQLLENNQGISDAQAGEASSEIIRRNKKKLEEIYPRTFMETANLMDSNDERPYKRVQELIQKKCSKKYPSSTVLVVYLNINGITDPSLFHKLTFSSEVITDVYLYSRDQIIHIKKGREE